MPTHVYHPARNPPWFIDRVLVHPWDNVIAALSLLYGLLIVPSSLGIAFTPSPAVDQMPSWLALCVGSFIAAGGLLALAGLHWTGDKVSHGWATERFGWSLVLAAFASYAVIVIYIFPGSAFSWGTPLFLAGGAALRVLSLFLVERDARRSKAEREAA